MGKCRITMVCEVYAPTEMRGLEIVTDRLYGKELDEENLRRIVTLTEISCRKVDK